MIPRLDQGVRRGLVGPRSGRAGAGGFQLKALVLDDSQAARRVLAQMLGELGFEVQEAAGAREALLLLNKEVGGTALALVDLNMPGMGGLELVAEVRADRALDAVKLVVVSAEVGPPTREASTRAGADACLAKPLSRPQLRETLATLGLVVQRELDSKDLLAVAETVWRGILSLPIRPGTARIARGEQTVSASIQISGVWEGAIAVHCPVRLARRIAATMFGGEIEDDLVQDALGEVANIIAGNVKRLLPGPCGLSLPTVVEGRDYVVRIPTLSAVVAGASLECEGIPFEVTVHRKPRKAEPGEARDARP